MTTREQLLIDAQVALLKRDLVEYNNIMDALEELDMRDARKRNWDDKEKWEDKGGKGVEQELAN